MTRSALLTILALGAAILSGCGRLVDEDLSGCGGALSIDYRLRLVTNWQTELETVLSQEEDAPVAAALRKDLEGVFSDVAHDADLSFHDISGDRLEHLCEIHDSERFSCSLFLPAQTVLHVCSANVAESGPVILREDGSLASARLVLQTSEDKVAEPIRTGLFTGRKTLEVPSDGEARYEVDLFMANAATVLVLDIADSPPAGGIRACACGFADAFSLADSTYSYASDPLVKAKALEVHEGTQQCYLSVNFPSRDYRSPTRTVEETLVPFLSDNAPDPLWEWRVYVPLADGTVTESVLSVMTPLRAGQLKILKAKVHDTGIVSVSDPAVGVSVTLDWKSGGTHVIDL